MAQQLYVGYGLTWCKGKLLLFNPREVKLFRNQSSFDDLLDSTIEEATDQDIYVDHRLNRPPIEED